MEGVLALAHGGMDVNDVIELVKARKMPRRQVILAMLPQVAAALATMSPADQLRAAQASQMNAHLSYTRPPERRAG